MSVGGRTFASVHKHRNYRLYFGGQAVSFTGTWVQQIAGSWLAGVRATSSSVTDVLEPRDGPVRLRSGLA